MESVSRRSVCPGEGCGLRTTFPRRPPGHGRRADHPARHDQRIVRQIIEVYQLGRTDLLERLERQEQPDMGVAAASGAEHGAAASERAQRRLIEQPFHDRTLLMPQCPCIYHSA